jgi:hypothetical protein
MEKKNKPLPTPYPELNRILQDFVDWVQAVLSTNFVGAYLQGSFGFQSDTAIHPLLSKQSQYLRTWGEPSKRWTTPRRSIGQSEYLVVYGVTCY